MTGPNDPGSDADDWGFPEVDPAGPASTQLPPPEPEPGPGFDTGSDAWWRAQAQAQRTAAQHDPVVPASTPTPEAPPVPDLVEPEALLPEALAPSPLDGDWLPTDLSELRPTEPEVVVEVVAAPEPEPEPTPEATDPHGFPPVEDEPIWTGTSYDDVTRTRAPVEPDAVGPLRALAGAALAVAGVALGIGALLLLGDDEPKGAPTVTAPTSSGISTTAPSATASAAPTATPTPTATATATAPGVIAPSAPATQAAMLPVSVLNNSKIKGLADRSAARFRAGGWPVALTGNYRGGTIAQTTVYYAPGEQASAERFAAQFGISRVAPRFPGLPTRGMTVVLTRDYT